MRTQVAIIGGGPSGLLLSQLLHRKGIDTIVLERKTKEYVLSRIRAGILETGFIDLMREAGVAERLDRECLIHDGTHIALDQDIFHVSFKKSAGRSVVVYGQTELTRDLYEAREAADGKIYYEIEDAEIHDADTAKPHLTFTSDGRPQRIDCDFIAGCDGFHGISRKTIPLEVRREYEKVYPFGWLGILSQTPPVDDELIYSCSQRGFALCSMRNEQLSRYYIQCALSDHPDDWSDAAFWDELRRRLPGEQSERLVIGPSIEKSIAPLRSFVTEPMQWGRLFLCGDAAHIVPPTGAKGLNTAASDVHYLYHALCEHYLEKSEKGLEAYSGKALARIWKAERFSWWMTMLLHRFPEQTEFDLRIQRSEIGFLKENESARKVFAENYAGLPY